uniref:Uncharacterized protein n=1 Tax=Phlebotomus papatasi TaxID=29031 RepID=A0A1B0D9R9_PHLPP
MSNSEDSMKFLWSAAIQLPGTSPTMQLLKAHYASRSISLAERSGAPPDNLQSFTGVSSMCPKCAAFWASGAFSLSLKPAKRLKARTKRFVIKHYRDKKNTKLRKISRKLAHKNFNSAVFTCRVCKNISKIPLVRSVKKKSPEPRNSLTSSPGKRLPGSQLENPPKKKKKKKDPFAGLNRDVLLAVQKKPQKTKEHPIQERPSVGKLARILKKTVSISGNKLDSMLK